MAHHPSRGDLLRALSHARDAVGWWGGPVAPEAPGESAEATRAATTRDYLAAVDLLATSALAEDDVDEAVRWLERGADADPLDERWWLRVHAILRGAGRSVAAHAAAVRAAEAMSAAGVPTSPAVLAALSSRAPAPAGARVIVGRDLVAEG